MNWRSQECKWHLRKECKYWCNPWHMKAVQGCRISFYAFSHSSCSHWPWLQTFQWETILVYGLLGLAHHILWNFLHIFSNRALYRPLYIFFFFFKFVSTARWAHQWHFQLLMPWLILTTLNKNQVWSGFPTYAYWTAYSGSIHRQL